ncbi:MAG: formamidopyrimidine-DNA glycosylase (fpg) [Acidobacteria bacterium]|nr:formamidopyrimidine-DNA glycosylase (fpg) [Acidobacteriota bacterium]
MPELPEVELVAQSLNKLVSGRRIFAAELLRQRLAPENPPPVFAEKLGNSDVNHVKRRGKHILFDLSGGNTLITHLRMSGRFMLLPAERELPKHTHAVFYFTDETRLVFQDQRHFGLMKIVETENLNESAELKKLAPEPFSDEFNRKYFREILKTSKRGLKEFLLDQTKVCGLGNIYASEALFIARINPQISADRLSPRKADLLHGVIREVLSESIRHGSTLNVDPENIDGSYYGGGFENRWRVYGQENFPCTDCKTEIKRLKQGGRSTYFCPKCQK